MARPAPAARRTSVGARLALDRCAGGHDRRGALRTIHRALLAGLLSNIGCQGRRRRRALPGRARDSSSSCIPAPASPGKAPKWVLAAELTDTTRLYARCAARIEPRVDRAGRRSAGRPHYFDPQWDPDARRGRRRRTRRALWLDAGGATARVVRRDRSGGRARGLPARGLGPRRYRDQGRVPRAQPAAVAASPSSSTRPGGRTCWSTTRCRYAFYAERVPTGIHSPRGSSIGESPPSAPTRGSCT